MPWNATVGVCSTYTAAIYAYCLDYQVENRLVTTSFIEYVLIHSMCYRIMACFIALRSIPIRKAMVANRSNIASESLDNACLKILVRRLKADKAKSAQGFC